MVLVCGRIFSRNFKQSIRALSSQAKGQYVFFNDDLAVQRPFPNVVQIDFGKVSPSISHEEFRQAFQMLYGPVHAAEVVYTDQIGYVSFVEQESKSDALSSSPGNSLPFSYTVSDYSLKKSMLETNRSPFSSIMVAAYRPSQHSVGKILMKFLEFDVITGSHILPCPYDSDRAFVYCNYYEGKGMHAASRAFSSISGPSVARNPASLSSVEDVDTWKFIDMECRRYGLYVNVRSDQYFTEELCREVVEYLGEYGEIDEMDVQQFRINVKFKYPRSIFKMFYEKTMFGRIRTQIGKSNTEITINTCHITNLTREFYSIRFTHMPKSDLNYLEYFNELLDLVGCNPGIASVVYNRKAQQAWLKLPLPWYVKDVSCKVHQFLELGEVPEQYQGLQVHINSPHWFCEYQERVREGVIKNALRT